MLLGTFFLALALPRRFVSWDKLEDYFYISMIGAGILASVYRFLMRNPVVLRLDEKGLSSATASLWPRRVLWSKVANCEEVRRWNYRGDLQPVYFYFRDVEGRTLLCVGVSPKDADVVVAQIEGIFTGESKISGA